MTAENSVERILSEDGIRVRMGFSVDGIVPFVELFIEWGAFYRRIWMGVSFCGGNRKHRTPSRRPEKAQIKDRTLVNQRLRHPALALKRPMPGSTEIIRFSSENLDSHATILSATRRIRRV
jgi:hypothetical protein